MFRISKVENQWQFVFNCHLYLLFEHFYLNTFRNRILVAVVQTTFTDSHDSKPRKLWRWTCDKWLKLLPPFFPHVFRKMRMTADGDSDPSIFGRVSQQLRHLCQLWPSTPFTWLTKVDNTSQELVTKSLSIHLHTVFQGVYIPESPFNKLKMAMRVQDQLTAFPLVILEKFPNSPLSPCLNVQNIKSVWPSF